MKEIKKSASFKSKQKGKEVKFNIDLNYSPEYDSFIIKVKEGEGFMSYSWNIERMPLEVIQKLNEMLEEVLIKAGSETEMKEHKMFDGGNFQAGVYAKGGSLQAHGIKEGDTFIRTISGVIQKVRDKDGKIVYINLANGERDSQPPLPFNDGGEVTYFVNKDGIRVRSVAKPKRELSQKEWMAKNNESREARAYKRGGALVGNQKRIDMNHNGEIDAEDFKLLRSSMNGAWRNERKHVNHNEDYEVRYARPRPSRTGYKGKRNFADGGEIEKMRTLSFKSKQIAEKNKKQIVDYFGDRILNSSINKGIDERGNNGFYVEYDLKKQKYANGAVVKKKSGNPKMKEAMVLAKKIRKDGEKWTDAVKRAYAQI